MGEYPWVPLDKSHIFRMFNQLLKNHSWPINKGLLFRIIMVYGKTIWVTMNIRGIGIQPSISDIPIHILSGNHSQCL